VSSAAQTCQTLKLALSCPSGVVTVRKLHMYDVMRDFVALRVNGLDLDIDGYSCQSCFFATRLPQMSRTALEIAPFHALAQLKVCRRLSEFFFGRTHHRTGARAYRAGHHAACHSHSLVSSPEGRAIGRYDQWKPIVQEILDNWSNRLPQRPFCRVGWAQTEGTIEPGHDQGSLNKYTKYAIYSLSPIKDTFGAIAVGSATAKRQ